MKEFLTAHTFFDGHTVHGSTKIHLQDGIIQGITPHKGPTDFFCVGPGFLDLQMNGFESVDISDCTIDELAQLDRLLLARGTTHWLATLITAPLDKLSQRIAVLDEAYRSNKVPGMLGIHVEGPFLGSAPGAHRTDWIVPIDMEWLHQLPSSVRLVTIAPEQQLAVAATEVLTKMGIAVSMGHSRPSVREMDTMVEAGSTMVTHLYNGMSGVHHRETGMALRALVDPRVCAGLIADLSHVSRDAVALAFAAKGGHGVCLVSDTVAWDSSRAKQRGIQVVDGSPQLPNGILAGSSTPLSECVQRVVQQVGIDWQEAFTAATVTPARIIHRADLSQIREGSPANLVAIDDSVCVVGAWRALVSHRA